MSGQSVEVDLASIRRAWRRAGRGAFWVQLLAAADDEYAFARAVDDTNEQYEDMDFDGPFGGLSTETDTGFVVELSDGADDIRLEAWLTNFAGRLTDVGFTGVLRAASGTSWPAWLDTNLPPALTAFIGWTFDLAAMTADPGRTSHWHVPADATERIAEHAARWTASGGPNVFMTRDGFPFKPTKNADVARILSDGAAKGCIMSTLRYAERGAHGRSANFAPGAETLFKIIGESQPWSDRMAALRELITELPEHVNLAFVRSSSPISVSWVEVGSVVALHGIGEADVRYNKHLLDKYVPDANGLQVLRDEHLSNAHDLSQWTITEIGYGRHLVEHPDLAAWYMGAQPRQEILDRAREDFGAMILTEETIRANPPPWR